MKIVETPLLRAFYAEYQRRPSPAAHQALRRLIHNDNRRVLCVNLADLDNLALSRRQIRHQYIGSNIIPDRILEHLQQRECVRAHFAMVK